MLISELAAVITAKLIDAVKVNQSHPIEMNGQLFWLKQRRFGRSLIIVCGNVFLKYSNSKIRMFSRTHEWQIWEVECYRLLYGEQSEINVVGSRAVRIPNISGMSLKQCLETGILTVEIMYAAALEFQRVHSLRMSITTEYWSHGDPHLENILYDSETRQAHLIDFETRHQLALSVHERQADDLLVFLLDLLGRDNSGDWLELSTAFIQAYGNRSVLEVLAMRLVIPDGLEAVLWKTRTNYINRALLAERLALLKEYIQP